jgi:DNA-binding transcriptional LysR family regulator
MAVTVTQLQTFLAVAREGSVSSAAEKLFVTQPSISAAVSALSKELGVDLTERVGRGVGLTPAGEAFRPYAADVIGLLEQGRQAAREASDASLRRLRIVAVATAGEYLVPSLLRAFHHLHPEVELQLEVANRATVFERVLDHAADVAIAGRPPQDERIVGTPFARNDYVMIAAPDDLLAAPKSVRPQQLGERTWLQREQGSGTRQLVSEFLAHHDLKPRTLTLGSNGAIKQAVMLGLGVSLQSRVAVASELRAGTLVEVPVRGGLPEREWYALHSPIPTQRLPVQQFLEFVHGAAGLAAASASL